MAKPSTKAKAGTSDTREEAAVEVDAPVEVAPAEAKKPAAKAKESAAVVLRKKDFVERVLDAAGDVNKNQAKAVIDHTLAQILVALQKGETLAVAPLGKLRLTSNIQKDDGDRLTVKIKLVSEGEEKS